jgi:thiosulfate reductase cytochrome b subunit/DMSO/TMAO reductase YedYZ molybdopterin-dependent catalytic subunit
MKKQRVVTTEKHPLFVRWTHWINFPILTLMIWSGLMIYWANDVFWPPIPDSVYRILHLDHRLAEGMAYHFALMWVFAVNGLLYVATLIITGEWRDLIPNQHSFKGAFKVILHDFGISKKPLPQEKFNSAQRIAYTLIIVMGFGSLVSGLAIYKPIQVGGLTQSLGGYEQARLIHYLLTAGYIAFFFIHVGQVIRAGWINFAAMVGLRRPRLAFAALLIGLIGGFAVFTMLRYAPQSDGLASPFRRVLDFNASLFEKFLEPNRTDPIQAVVPAGKRARFNGDVGLSQDFDPSHWKMKVNSPVGGGAAPTEVTVTIDDLKKLPRTQITNDFKCIEGWSEVMSFAGVRFIDFMKHYHVGTHSGQDADFENNRKDLYGYVGLQTPDGEYYVSIDMKSMLDPQTLLAYEQNGAPLTAREGAPLRLAIPNKYGVKNIKRIGQIIFSDSRLPDYWGEQGYDWFIGL